MFLREFLFGSRRWWHLPPTGLCLRHGNVALRPLGVCDWNEWRKLRESSRDFLAPWEPRWPENYLSLPRFFGMVRRQRREWRQGTDYAFAIFVLDGDGTNQLATMAGGVQINDIQRGASNKGTLSYWMGEPYSGQGIMTEAARLACAFAFDVIRLHRLEASCMPHNERSTRLLKRLGFTNEGMAHKYIYINGKWEDHLLWGKSFDD